MAELTVTASQVVKSSDPDDIIYVKSAEAIPIGDSVYVSDINGRAYKARSNVFGGSWTTPIYAGIAVSAVSALFQWVAIQISGTVTLGAASGITQGATYYISASSYGGIVPESDVSTGHNVQYLGVGNDSNGIVMPSDKPFLSWIQHA